jgi:membrane protein required for colicin V production
MNWADYVLIALAAFSCIAGLMRGLLRELISLGTWLLAIAIAWRFSEVLEPHLGGLLAGHAVRPWAARAILFLVVLLIGTAIGAIVTHFVRLSMFNALDHGLGMLFGLLRGIVVVGLLLMLCHTLQLQRESWYRQAMLIPAGEHVADVLRGIAGSRAEAEAEAARAGGV